MKRVNLNIDDKSLLFNFKNKLSNKDIVVLKKLDESDKIGFILSKLGLNISQSYRSSVRDIKNEVKKDTQDLMSNNPNRILNHLKDLTRIQSHKPISKSIKFFGIEIECFIPHDSLDYTPNENSSSGGDVECYSCEGRGTATFTHRDSGSTTEGECPYCDGSGTVWDDEAENNDDEGYIPEVVRMAKREGIKRLDIKTDGSLEDDSGYAVEFNILIPQNDFTELEKLCKFLDKIGAYVNKTCGLHVHLDMRGCTESQLNTVGTRFSESLPYLLKMVPKTRRDNRFCKPVVSTLKGDRYSAVNLTAFDKFKTIEVRLHTGSTSFEKITNWLKILKAISSKRSVHISSKKSFINHVATGDNQLKEYILKRIELFGSGKQLEDIENNDSEDQAS